MTAGTLDERQAGALRTDAQYRVVADPQGNVLHEPPPASELDERLRRMCDFANSRTSGGFVHPVVRAVLLHLWLAHDHPFVDGNGRTARALFYWSMLNSGYWLVEYLSISAILKKGPMDYARSFLYAETDENDATYFVLHQLGVIILAIRALHSYLVKKAAEVRQVEKLVRDAAGFNHRQLALLSHALRHPGVGYTIRSHQQSHNVVYETARSDLFKLAERGLLDPEKRGRTYHFYSAENLSARLRRL